jgi:starch-binding outer membrane protein, SusD/RagB family
MRYKFFNKIVILGSIVLLLSDCKKPLETTPKNSLELTFALDTKEGLQAVLTAIYNSLQTSGYYGRDFIVIPEVLADNCEITTANSNRFITQGNNTPGAHVGIWTAAYANINRANIILSFVDGNSKATAAEKQQWKGEAYFLRALMYHDLIKSYARSPLFLNSGTGGSFDLGVPLITMPVVNAESISYPKRNTITEVYTQIMQDLNQANSLLSNVGSGPSFPLLTAYRARKVAAQALASRVELYNGNWAQSERWADSVIIQNRVPLAPSTSYFNTTVAPGWGNAHPETIFGLSYQTGESNPGTDALQYIYYRNLPNIQGYGDVTTQTSLRSALGVVGTTSTDLRFTNLVSVQTKSSQQVFYSIKWPGVRQLGQDDIMILRTSEIFLNRAEARAKQGGAKEALAIADVNLIKARAGIATLATSGAGVLTGSALMNEILKERRVELAYEGHRLFDIVRNGLDVIKNPSSVVFGTNAYNFLIAPILQADIDANPQLVKNPGY